MKRAFLAASTGHWLDLFELPKKVDEAFEWTWNHPFLAVLILVSLAGAALILRRPKLYFISKRGRAWVHYSLSGEIIGEYSSRAKAIAGASAYHSGKRVLLHVLDSSGNLFKVLEFGSLL